MVVVLGLEVVVGVGVVVGVLDAMGEKGRKLLVFLLKYPSKLPKKPENRLFVPTGRLFSLGLEVLPVHWARLAEWRWEWGSEWLPKMERRRMPVAAAIRQDHLCAGDNHQYHKRKHQDILK